MAIYGRMGMEVTILRVATPQDVEDLDHRKPDRYDEVRIEQDALVVVACSFGRRLYDVAFLRATGGSIEISARIEETKKNKGDG